MEKPTENSDHLDRVRHTLSHLLATVVLEKYPDAQIAIGPTIDNGFYYDIDAPNPITVGDLPKLEKRMRELIKQNLEMKQVSIKKLEDGGPHLKDNPYKRELVEELMAKKETPTFYQIGTFVDLCRGGHVANTSEIDPSAFKLTKVAGAYWRGDSTKPMLQRIYGVAFENKQALDAYLTMIAEAEKRDHKRLGKELDLFIFSDLIGPGLPMYTFKGAIVRREIVNFSNELQAGIGYQEVHTPNINKAELFKVSGHYEKYKSDMLRVISNYSNEEYFLKPMNCPQHTQIYASHMRSYKDLPIRIADFANLYRDEKPGELSGLIRLRSFCQDDGHSFCRPDQIKDEFRSILKVIERALAVYGMEYYVRLSLWDPGQPEKYLGEPKDWERSQTILRQILDDTGLTYVTAVGEAAIYGPKMDIMTKDSLGREWQISTIQLDLIMPSRFKLTYVDRDGSEQTPIMIHRALIGSPERFLGILTEHYAGNFPTWLAPVQVQFIPVGSTHVDHCQKLAAEFRDSGIRVHVDDVNETVGYKIRKAEKMKIPYMLVIGDKELASPKLQVRVRGSKDVVAVTTKKFLAQLRLEIAQRMLTPKP